MEYQNDKQCTVSEEVMTYFADSQKQQIDDFIS